MIINSNNLPMLCCYSQKPTFQMNRYHYIVLNIGHSNKQYRIQSEINVPSLIIDTATLNCRECKKIINRNLLFRLNGGGYSISASHIRAK